MPFRVGLRLILAILMDEIEDIGPVAGNNDVGMLALCAISGVAARRA